MVTIHRLANQKKSSPPSKPKTSTPTFIIKTPDSPYVPEWEEGHVIEVTESEFASDAFQFKNAPPISCFN